MAGILGNDSSLASKAQELAKAVVGETSQEQVGTPTAQIILSDMKLRGVNPKAGLTGMLAAQKQGTLKLWRKDDTIMAAQKLSPIAAKVHFFTMDPEPKFQQIVKNFIATLKQNGCQAIYDVVVDPHIVRALQAAGAQVRQSDNPQFKLEATI
jgi:hypothetical protein